MYKMIGNIIMLGNIYNVPFNYKITRVKLRSD